MCLRYVVVGLTHTEGDDHKERQDEPRDADSQAREDSHGEDEDTCGPSAACRLLAAQLVWRDALLVCDAEDDAREKSYDYGHEQVEDQQDAGSGCHLCFYLVRISLAPVYSHNQIVRKVGREIKVSCVRQSTRVLTLARRGRRRRRRYVAGAAAGSRWRRRRRRRAAVAVIVVGPSDTNPRARSLVALAVVGIGA